MENKIVVRKKRSRDSANNDTSSPAIIPHPSSLSNNNNNNNLHISFEVISGPHNKSVYNLRVNRQQSQQKKIWTIGRRDTIMKKGNGISLSKDNEISSKHAQICLIQTSKLEFIDLKSTNGTKINGNKIISNQPYILQPNDKIKIGITEMLYHGILNNPPSSQHKEESSDLQHVVKKSKVVNKLGTISEKVIVNEKEENINNSNNNNENHSTNLNVLSNNNEKNGEPSEILLCPVCNKDITSLNLIKRTEHINKCIEINDDHNEGNNNKENADSIIRKKTTVNNNTTKNNTTKNDNDTANDLQIALELQKEEQKNLQQQNSLTNIYICSICGKNMSHLSEKRRQIHLNKCIDKMEKAEKVNLRKLDKEKSKMKKTNKIKKQHADVCNDKNTPSITAFQKASDLDIDVCLICNASLKDSNNNKLARLAHIQFCASQNNITEMKMESIIEEFEANADKQNSKNSLWNWMTANKSPNSESSVFEKKSKKKREKLKRKKKKKMASTTTTTTATTTTIKRKKRKKNSKNTSYISMMEEDALQHAIALSKSLEDSNSRVSINKDHCDIELARLERRLAAVDAQIESMKDHRNALAYNLERAKERAKERHNNAMDLHGGATNVTTTTTTSPNNNNNNNNNNNKMKSTKEYGSGQMFSPSTATRNVFNNNIAFNSNVVKSNLPRSSISEKFTKKNKGNESNNNKPENRVDDNDTISRSNSALWRASSILASQEEYKNKSKAVREMNKKLMAENDNDDDENDFDEDHTALSQLVAQVEESFDTSSSEEDEEVDNAGNESNHDVPLSNSSSHNLMLNEDDQSIASLWIENAPTEVKNSFPNWKQDITYVFKQSIQSLRTAREKMLLKKSEIEKSNLESPDVIACNYFIALIGSAIEYRKQNGDEAEKEAEEEEEVKINHVEKLLSQEVEVESSIIIDNATNTTDTILTMKSATKEIGGDENDDTNGNTITTTTTTSSTNNVIAIEDDDNDDVVDEPSSLELRIVTFIKQDKHLYEKILRFESIELSTLHNNLKLNQIKIKKKDLQALLDKQGIINSW